jgi:hypothetical protein
LSLAIDIRLTQFHSADKKRKENTFLKGEKTISSLHKAGISEKNRVVTYFFQA